MNHIEKTFYPASGIDAEIEKEYEAYLTDDEREEIRTYERMSKLPGFYAQATKKYRLSGPYVFRRELIKEKRAKGACERCGERGDLELHHHDCTTYFHEKPQDFIALCAKCHGRRHPRWVRKSDKKSDTITSVPNRNSNIGDESKMTTTKINGLKKVAFQTIFDEIWKENEAFRECMVAYYDNIWFRKNGKGVEKKGRIHDREIDFEDLLEKFIKSECWRKGKDIERSNIRPLLKGALNKITHNWFSKRDSSDPTLYADPVLFDTDIYPDGFLMEKKDGKKIITPNPHLKDVIKGFHDESDFRTKLFGPTDKTVIKGGPVASVNPTVTPVVPASNDVQEYTILQKEVAEELMAEIYPNEYKAILKDQFRAKYDFNDLKDILES